MTASRRGYLVALLTLLGCGPSGVVEECIPVDPDIPQDQMWCDAFTVHDPELEWEGTPPADGTTICVEPDADGECASCPLDDISASLETPLRALLANKAPTCELERWEVPCMRTVEGGMTVSETDYCCYQVAYWGENCGP